MNLDALIGRFVGKPTGRFLDAGCGTGGTLRHLNSVARLGQPVRNRHFPAGRGLRQGADHRPHRGELGECPALPRRLLPPLRFDRRDLSAGRHPFAGDLRVLSLYRAGGHLILQAPAYMWLWGYHDVQCHTAQRFTSFRLKSLLSEHGIGSPLRQLLEHGAAPAACYTAHAPAQAKTERDVREYPALLDRLFGGLVSFEAMLIRSGVHLPFSSSVILVART
mgnify:CR=1 FL=1